MKTSKFDDETEKFKSRHIARNVFDYLISTFKGDIDDTEGIKNSDVKKFYEKQFEYIRTNYGNSCTFVLNLEHYLMFQISDETMVHIPSFLMREINIQEHQNINISEYISWNYLRHYEDLRIGVYQYMKRSGVFGDLVIKQERVFVGFTNVKTKKSIRELRSRDVGRLLCITGTVTRTSEVRPELLFGKFLCQVCGQRCEKIKQDFVYTKPIKCVNSACLNTKSFQLLLDESELKIKVQENTDEIPTGIIPRTIEIIVRNDLVEIPKPGDKMNFYGTLIVLPDISKIIKRDISGYSDKVEAPSEKKGKKTDGRNLHDGVGGLKVLGINDMSYKLSFLAHYVRSVVSAKMEHILYGSDINKYIGGDEEENLLDSFDQKELLIIQKMKNDRRIFQNLVKSVCPSIYGYDEIKRGVLLQMVGGVHKTTEEGINLRGDLNICIVGDPGTAKSQFLKWVANVLPRAIYTSGKASSSAGLTASVVKRNDTGEFSIEAGALMLADNGICCIDEFDKMNISDQVAIHEAMEQQTISIAKAGIRATLLARTAILAAANPIGGNYDKSKTLRANIGYSLSPAIISRFDLFFIICDRFDEQYDRNIAEHIIGVHRGEEIEEVYNEEEIRLYLKYIQRYTPLLTEEAASLLSKTYVKLRNRDKIETHSFRITVRQLESLIRLSEAIARVYCDSKVRERHAKEAILLLQKTMTKLDIPDIDLELDNTEEYINLIRREDRKNRKELFYKIKSNVRDYQVTSENDKNNLDSTRNNIIVLEREIEDLKNKRREIALESMDSMEEGDTQEVDSKIELKEKEIKKLMKSINALQQKANTSMMNYLREKKKEEEAFRNMEEELKAEIKKDEEDKLKRPKKKRKTKKSVSISQENYKKILYFVIEKLKKKQKKDETGLTVGDLIDMCKRSNLKDDVDFKKSDKHFVKLLKKVITRLIVKDNILVDLNIDEEDNFDSHKIVISPNFDV